MHSNSFSRAGSALSLAGLTLAVATATIGAALAFEHFGGHLPCPLCLQQRYAYYAAVPLLLLATGLLAGGKVRLPQALLLGVAAGFLANSGLGAYQGGAEWGYWPGPDTCAGSQSITPDAGSLLRQLGDTKVVRCDAASWHFLGLSFAGWNALISLALAGLGAVAAWRAGDATRQTLR